MPVFISFAAAAALLLLAAALATDLRSRTIPNGLTLPFFAAGFLFHAIAGGWNSAGEAAWGAAAGFVPLLLLYGLGGIGAGDVKLFGAVGVWIGAAAVVQLMMASIVYAGMIGLLLMGSRRIPSDIVRRSVSIVIAAEVPDGDASDESGKDSPRKRVRLRMPFMIAVVPAVVTVWPVFP
jgi:prepilin peptidase CpaA